MSTSDQITPTTATAITVQSAMDDALAVWLKDQFETLHDGMKADYVMIGHINVGGQVNELSRWAAAPYNHSRASECSVKIRRLTTDYANVRASHTDFALQVWWPDKTLTHILFSIDGAQRHSLSATEPPTNEGLLKQQMRHIEVIMKIATGSHVQQMEITERIIDRQQKAIEKLEEGRYKVLEHAEKLMDASAERQQEAIKQQSAEARKTAGFQHLMEIAPLIKAKLVEAVTGQKITTDHPAMHLVRGVFDGMELPPHFGDDVGHAR